MFSCSSGSEGRRVSEDEARAESEIAEDAAEEPVFDREFFESRLAELNIPVFETAEFDHARERLYGDGYQLRYTIPDNSDESLQLVYDYYHEIFDDAAERAGYERMNIDRLIMLRDGDAIVLSVTNLRRATDDVHLLTFLFGS
ncbi:MAG: hypothetical protein EA408_06775 [Marinilabiliales bacterium]|nr:MAG: hypothetical protein EA408_06775 [Marinilabiliales bacterium]